MDKKLEVKKSELLPNNLIGDKLLYRPKFRGETSTEKRDESYSARHVGRLNPS